MKITNRIIKIAIAILAAPQEKHYGYTLGNQLNFSTGAIYPLLSEMMKQGWLQSEWEDPEDVNNGRPVRKYYTLTEKGRKELVEVIRNL